MPETQKLYYLARRQGLPTSRLGPLSPCRRLQDDIAIGPRSTGQADACCYVPRRRRSRLYFMLRLAAFQDQDDFRGQTGNSAVSPHPAPSQVTASGV